MVLLVELSDREKFQIEKTRQKPRERRSVGKGQERGAAYRVRWVEQKKGALWCRAPWIASGKNSILAGWAQDDSSCWLAFGYSVGVLAQEVERRGFFGC
jgi:hypothetical protein